MTSEQADTTPDEFTVEGHMTVGQLKAMLAGVSDHHHVVIGPRDGDYENVGWVGVPRDDYSGTWMAFTLIGGADFDTRQI
jgi:hypothetical protein